MRVLLTGGTGFIGEALAEQLVARGDQVRALVRPASRTAPLTRLGAELAPGHLGDPASLRSAVQGVDAVLHLAGLVKARSSRELFAANADGTRALAQACAGRASPPRLVHVSSLAAAGPAAPDRPRVEGDPPAPVSDYGRSKLGGERALRAFAGLLRASVVRPPIVYGPREKELMPELLRMARLGVVLRSGSAAKRYSVVHVADLCAGILAVLDRGACLPAPGEGGAPDGRGLYFLDSGQVHSWDELALAACAAAGRRAWVLPVPEAAGYLLAAGARLKQALTGQVAMISFDKLREARQLAWTCSSGQARSELGWAPRFDLARGMEDTVAWFREQGQG